MKEISLLNLKLVWILDNRCEAVSIRNGISYGAISYGKELSCEEDTLLIIEIGNNEKP